MKHPKEGQTARIYELRDNGELMRYIGESYENGQKKQAAEVIRELFDELQYITDRPTPYLMQLARVNGIDLELLHKLNDFPNLPNFTRPSLLK